MKNSRAEKFRPPHQLLRLTGPVRAVMELGSLHLAEPWLHSLPGGDGHPALVIPGFTGGDMSTIVLRNFLDQLGYPAHRWEQGVNLGIRPKLYQGAKKVLLRLNEEYGTQPRVYYLPGAGEAVGRDPYKKGRLSTIWPWKNIVNGSKPWTR